MIDNLQSAFGLLVLMALAWLLSERRRTNLWKVAVTGAGVQLAMAVVLLKLPGVQGVFRALNDFVLTLQGASDAGTSFVFGYLGGAPLPFEETRVGSSFVLAFRALPLVIVISALTALMTYWRILPLIVRAFSAMLRKVFGIGGAVGLGTAANVFVGMVEAPLFIRPYLERLSRSELFTLMCAGMATIAGTVLVLYATFLRGVIPDAVAHLLVASIISAPAAITIARLMVPDDGAATDAEYRIESEATSSMDALTRGTQSGLTLFLNIVAMLIVFVAMVHLVNAVLSALPDMNGEPVTLERLLGYVLAPITWLMGIPWREASVTGSLMGTKTVLNEFLAYLRLADLPADALSERSRLIISYALCGFANFGSLGIMIGGLTTLVPGRRDEILALGLKSILAGTLATSCTGAVVGILL